MLGLKLTHVSKRGYTAIQQRVRVKENTENPHDWLIMRDPDLPRPSWRAGNAENNNNDNDNNNNSNNNNNNNK